MDVWQEVSLNWSELCVAMGCTRIRVPGAIAHAYPIHRSGAFYNFALVQDPGSFVIEEVERIYSRRGLPFAITMPGLEPYSDLGNSLGECGYSLVPVWTLMTHNEWTGERNAEFGVDEIGRSDLPEWFEIQHVFPDVETFGATRLEMIRTISEKNSAHLLMVSLDGRAVGAGLLFLHGRVASIHMIATLTEFRRRHIATTITLEALHRAKNESSDLVWLRTRRGGIGEKVYTKIGFDVFSDILSYTKTPEFEDATLPQLQTALRAG